MTTLFYILYKFLVGSSVLVHFRRVTPVPCPPITDEQLLVLIRTVDASRRARLAQAETVASEIIGQTATCPKSRVTILIRTGGTHFALYGTPSWGGFFRDISSVIAMFTFDFRIGVG